MGIFREGRVVKCPKCETELAVLALIPDEQRFTLNIQGEGGMLSAETVGGTLTGIRKLMQLSAKRDGVNVEVMIEKIAQEDGKLSVDFVVLNKKRTSPPKGPHS